jgi:hypothetical protein
MWRSQYGNTREYGLPAVALIAWVLPAQVHCTRMPAAWAI